MDTAVRIVVFTAIVLASQVRWWTLTTKRETEQLQVGFTVKSAAQRRLLPGYTAIQLSLRNISVVETQLSRQMRQKLAASNDKLALVVIVDGKHRKSIYLSPM